MQRLLRHLGCHLVNIIFHAQEDAPISRRMHALAQCKVYFCIASQGDEEKQSALLPLFSQGLTLHFVVLSFDRYSRDDVIGEVMVDLGELDLSSSDHAPVAIAREITPRSFKVSHQPYQRTYGLHIWTFCTHFAQLRS